MTPVDKVQCDLCADLSLHTATFMLGLAETADAIDAAASGLHDLVRLTPTAVDDDANARDGFLVVFDAALEATIPLTDSFDGYCADVGLGEHDELCEPNPFRQHLRALLETYDRMSSLHHFVSGRSARIRNVDA